jgi:hypothetical protein
MAPRIIIFMLRVLVSLRKELWSGWVACTSTDKTAHYQGLFVLLSQ